MYDKNKTRGKSMEVYGLRFFHYLIFFKAYFDKLKFYIVKYKETSKKIKLEFI